MDAPSIEIEAYGDMPDEQINRRDTNVRAERYRDRNYEDTYNNSNKYNNK